MNKNKKKVGESAIYLVKDIILRYDDGLSIKFMSSYKERKFYSPSGEYMCELASVDRTGIDGYRYKNY